MIIAPLINVFIIKSQAIVFRYFSNKSSQTITVAIIARNHTTTGISTCGYIGDGGCTGWATKHAGSGPANGTIDDCRTACKNAKNCEYSLLGKKGGRKEGECSLWKGGSTLATHEADVYSMYARGKCLGMNTLK